ncbi:MFS transporter [Pseudomonas putida]|uniref:MFS transporter n=1 Tax=Pseudomonas putida TaxID=303 RepID=UPI0009A165EE|nr:MFS transporter [Pseudomonas putida]
MSIIQERLFSRKTLSACRLAFFLSGAGMGAWAPLVPYARERADISEGQLGLLLLCLGTGSMLMMPFVGRLAHRIGCRNTMYLASVGIAASLLALAVVPSYWQLVVALLLFGASIGTADVNMNLQGAMVEQHYNRPMMSGFHGLFSAGTIFSAALVSVSLWLGLTPVQAIGTLLLAGTLALVTVGRNMLPFATLEAKTRRSRPTGFIVLLGVLCFIAFLVEGSMLDWSAVFLNSERNMPMDIAGIGYAAFSVTMAAGRLSGDVLVARFGTRLLLVAGSAIGLAGMAAAIVLDHWLASVIGFVLVGAGIANLVPIFCSCVGRQRQMAVAQGLAIMNSIGYMGILMGPALIGFLAHVTSLSVALMAAASLLCVVLCCSKVALKP